MRLPRFMDKLKIKDMKPFSKKTKQELILELNSEFNGNLAQMADNYNRTIDELLNAMKTYEKTEIMKVEEARQVLKDAGFQVANLWSLQDVMDNYECSEEEAMNLLEQTLTNDHVIESIWASMDIIADINGIERKQS